MKLTEFNWGQFNMFAIMLGSYCLQGYVATQKWYYLGLMFAHYILAFLIIIYRPKE